MSGTVDAIVTSSPTRTLHRLSNYVSLPRRGATQDRFLLQSGINGADPNYFAAQARRNRVRFGKDGTRTVERTYKNQYGSTTKQVVEGEFVQGYHTVQSFAKEGPGALDPDDPNDVALAHQLGQELAREIAGPDRMAVVVTQRDGRSGMLHNHLVVDSISKADGKSLSSRVVTHKELRARHDELLSREIGLDDERVKRGLLQPRESYTNVNGVAPARAVDRKSPAELREAEAHAKWEAAYANASPKELEIGAHGDEPFSQAELKSRVASAMADPRAVDAESFKRIASDDYGVDVRLTNVAGRRGVSYQMERLKADGSGLRDPEPGDRRRGSVLGSDYSRAAVDRAIEDNAREATLAKQASQAKATQTPVTAKPVAPVAKPVATTRPKPESPEPQVAAPQPAAPVFRSALHDVEAKGNYKTVAKNLAAFEDREIPRLREGKRFQESDVPRGVTAKFLEAHGDSVEPELREVLTQRALKYEARNEAYRSSKELTQTAEERKVRAALERNPGLAAQAGQEQDRATEQSTLEAELRAELAKGDYTLKPEHAKKLPQAQKAQARERDLQRARTRARETELPSR